MRKLHSNFTQTPHKLHTNFTQTSHKLHINFTQFSHKLHTNFMKTSTEFWISCCDRVHNCGSHHQKCPSPTTNSLLTWRTRPKPIDLLKQRNVNKEDQTTSLAKRPVRRKKREQRNAGPGRKKQRNTA
jgi:hypothetical protein